VYLGAASAASSVNERITNFVEETVPTANWK
jgi:hypothetical protein